MKRVGLVAAAIALVGFGLWLGHATSATPAAPTPQLAAPVAAPRAPIAPRIAAHPTVPGLATDLRDPDPKIRRAAIAEVAASDNKDLATLLAASHDPDLGVAVVATTSLGALYRDGEIPAHELVARITDHALTERVRVAAMNGLGLVPANEGAALLTELASHGDVTERRSAAILLQHQAATAAVPALIAALADGDEYVRGNAVESLRTFARGRDFGTDAAAWLRWWQSRGT